jgi:enterochelin esterase-like enzyme
MRVRWAFIVLALSARPAHAGTQTISLFSPANGRNVNLVVYTPPDYATTTHRYPVVLDLHGIGGNPVNRANNVVPYLDAAIRAGTAMPMIYVFGDGQNDSFYGDAFDGHKQVYSNVIGEVLPYVDANFRTLNNRRFRATDGFSMGGFGAMMYASKRPDLFSAVVGYSSPYQDWAHLQANVKVPMYNSIQANFTPFSVYDQTQINAPLIASLDVKYRMLIGGDDTLLTSNQNFNTFLNAQLNPLGVPNIPLTVVPGIAHDGKAMYETGIGLDFLSDHFAGVTPGDADVDNDVDFQDLVILAQHYNTTSGGSWLTGDFTWDGRVEFADLVLLAQHYGDGAALAPNNFAGDWALAQSLVPEPALLSALPIAARLTIRRRVRGRTLDAKSSRLQNAGNADYRTARAKGLAHATVATDRGFPCRRIFRQSLVVCRFRHRGCVGELTVGRGLRALLAHPAGRQRRRHRPVVVARTLDQRRADGRLLSARRARDQA